MAHNANDETLNNPENIPGQTISTTGDTTPPNPETENMEVHHRPALHHKKKKWNEYFLEFLMIFLAVTMGFFAESYREHRVNNEKEKQSIASLIRCLENDTLLLNTMIHSNMMVATYLDSLIQLKDADLTTEENKQKFNEYGSGFCQNWFFKTNDAAMQQLKSSGMLRLIGNQKIIDGIFGYELKNKITAGQEADIYFLFKEFFMDFRKVVDLSFMRDTSVTGYTVTGNFFLFHYKKTTQLIVVNDPEKLKTIFSNAAVYASAVEAYAHLMREQKEYGVNLIDLLKKEYHLE